MIKSVVKPTTARLLTALLGACALLPGPGFAQYPPADRFELEGVPVSIDFVRLRLGEQHHDISIEKTCGQCVARESSAQGSLSKNR